MFQRSGYNYDETNDSPPFSDDDDDDAKTHQTKSALEHYNDSASVSLSSTPEMPNIGSYHGEDFSQKFSRLAPKPRIGGELCSLYEIPRKYRHIFSGYPCFNSVQSKVLNDVLHSDTPVVVSAPTGSGKTVIFELAIIRLLMKLDELKYQGDFIIVYMAPVKALCSERYFDWKAKFSPLGINCQEVTGDTDDYTLANLPRSHLILTTPEKWDSLTRKWKDNTKMVQLVKLFLIDEVHLLSEERRGPTLEAVVSRMKTITDVLRKQKLQYTDTSDFVQLPVGIRFMAVSATIFNIEDVASWLGTSPDSPAKHFKISEEQRPVKLQKIVIGYPCPRDFSQFRFEITLSFKLKPLLFKYAEGKPTLIFCSTRKGVDQTCSTLSKQITFSFNEEHRRKLLETVQTLSENKLKSSIIAGVGYHHAGMDRDDRHTVENLFRSGLLPVLVTTSTLAIGVNLPAHLVIVKATQQYAGGAYHDYTETQILQMIGRAGRPQFDTSAVAIIMTKDSQKSRYENLIEGKEPLESNLHRHLAEHLNSEVVLHTITEVGHAIEWIRSTFLYVRAIQNPCHYGIPAKLSKKGIETHLQEMCQRELNALASANLITVDNLTDIRPTANGAIMARFYLGLGTMKVFQKVTGQENLENLLNLIAACDEFSGLKLRVNEKKNLNLLNKSKVHETIRFPLQGKIANTEMKVNCLMQAFFGCLPVYEQSLKQDMLRISWIGERVTMALCQYLLQYKHYKVLLSATVLAKCFRCKLWENSPYVCRQLRGIGPALSSLLVASHKTSFQAIAESNPRDIELILNRAPPMGDALKAEVSHLPKFGLRVEPASLKPDLTKLNIYIEMTNKHLVEEYNAAGDHHWLVLIIGTSDNKCLLIERFKDTYLLQDTLSRSVTVKHTATTEIYINVISEKWSGLDVSLTTKFDEPCQAKHTLDQYLLKIGIDSRGKSALEISSEAASIMKKRKRNSLSQEINAINQKSFYDGNRLTLDKFKFTPTRNKKLAPSPQSILDNTIYENELNETDENLDKYNMVPFKNMKEADGQNVLTMANLHLSHADKQLDDISEQTMLEKNDIQKIPNNSRQIQDCLQKRSNENVIQSTFHDTTLKYNNFKTVERVEAVESSDPQVSDTSETVNADTEVLYTEPSEALDTPYITYMQESKFSIHNTFNAATNDNPLCNGKNKITGWNKLMKRAPSNEPQQIHEIIDLTQDCGIPKNCSAQKSSFTDVFQSNQTCNSIKSSFPYKSVSQSRQTKEIVEGSSHIHEASQSESFLKHFTTNHSFQNTNAQRIGNANESPGTVNIISPSDCTSILVNANENDLHGSDETKQVIKSDAQQHFQNKFSEINLSRSEERENLSNQKKDSDFTNQINDEMHQPCSKETDIVKNEQKFKRTLPKRFYPLFMKPDLINDDQGKHNETERKETYTENADTRRSPALQMETPSLSEASPGQLQEARSQTAFKLQCAFKDVQENEEENAMVVEENRERSSMGNSSAVLQPHEREHQEANINSKSENNNELQFHPIISQINDGPIKAFTEKFQEKMVESNILTHMNPEIVNLQPTKQFPDFPQNCNTLQPTLSFSLVADFDKFFEKLSADPNSKNMQFHQHATEAETKRLIQTPKYDKAWARDYLFNRKTKTPLSDGNIRFAQHSKSNGALQDQTVLHYNVPTFNKNKIKTLPLNYVEAHTHTADEPSNSSTLTSKETASLDTNYTAKFNKMAEELEYNYNVNESFAISESRDKCVPQVPNKMYFNCFGEPKQNSDTDVTEDKYKDFGVNEDAHPCNMEYPSPLQSSDSSEAFHLHLQHSNDSPYIIDTHKIKQRHKQKNNIFEITENNNFFYGDNNPEESSTIFHNKNNELFQTFIPSNTFAHSLIYPDEQSDSCLFPVAAATNLEETDVHSNGSLEEETQDYDKCLSPVVNSPLISNVSPQNSEGCDLPTPPLQLSSDDSDKCSQCSTCKATSPSVEDIKENEPLVIPEQYETKQYPYMFPMNNIPLSLPARLPVCNSQQVKQKHPAQQCISDLEYKRPRSIYLPNDKLQKFCPMSPTERKIQFSPAYKKQKWFPRSRAW